MKNVFGSLGLVKIKAKIQRSMSIGISHAIIRTSLMMVLWACPSLCLANVTFYASYKGSKLPNSLTVRLYKDGEMLGSDYYLSKSCTISTDGNEDSYTYVTNRNHKGSVNNGEPVRLKTGLFRYILTDSDGKPLSGVRVQIFNDGDEVTSVLTNAEGIADCYLAEGDKYAYKSDEASGPFTITADEETRIDQSRTNVSVMLKYKDVPAEGTYYLVADDGTESSASSISSTSDSGRLRFSCRYGISYRIRNGYGVYSEPFTPTADKNSFVVEHRKVTFVSGSDDPNVLYDFKVLGATQSSNYGNKKVSDGKGYVVYYLMPGKYKYSHLGSMIPFEVGDTDITLTLTSNQKTLRLIDASGRGVAGQKVKISDRNGGESQEYVSDDSGIASFKSISDGCYAQVNGFGEFAIGTSGSIDIRLTELVFNNSIFDNASSIYLKGGTTSLTNIKQGSHVWVPTAGQYTYSAYDDGQWIVNDADIALTGGSVSVGDDLHTVSIMAAEESGAPLSGFRFYVYSGNTMVSNSTTDVKGESSVYLKDGFYEFKTTSMQMFESGYIDSNRTIRYTVPDEMSMTVNVDGQPWSGYATFTRENGENVLMTCYHGVGTVRLSENESCSVSVGSMIHTCKVNVADGKTLDFYEARVVSEGAGLAFPIVSYYYENTQTKMLGGENLHLVAVPAANSSFKHWLINGKEYEASVVDYKVSGAVDAVAVFESSEYTIIDSKKVSAGSLDITVNDDYLVFNRNVCGNVDIYNASGVKVCSSYVVSDKMDISALAAGVHIGVLTEESSQYSVKFLKK